jgi:hypothetical protein
MDEQENDEKNPLKLINPSLEIAYYIMMLANHDIIKLVRSILWINLDIEVMKWV